jgi:hypothetical protein
MIAFKKYEKKNQSLAQTDGNEDSDSEPESDSDEDGLE